MITLLSFFRIVQVSHITYSVLVSTASHFSLQSQDYPETEIHGFFVQKLGKENCSFIQGKEEGIQWQEIGIYGEYLQLQITYECKLPVNIFSIKSIPVSQGIRIKKWRGFEKKDQENTEGIWVYVTPSREVYHKTEDCTHLKLSIQTMECEKVLQEGYTPCIRCIKSGKKEAVYYITEEGRRYHSTLSCSGLKRTVYKVKYEEVSDLKECQRCGGIW